MELMYASTRDANEKVTASQAILKGLANDGGLYVPTEIPSLDVSMEELSKMTYQETAYEVLKLFLTDYTEEELKNCINAAYDSKFDTEEIAPLVNADGAYYLELFHGPTIAFKDMALSILPHLLITAANPASAAFPVSPEVAVRITISFLTLFFLAAVIRRCGRMDNAISLKAIVGPWNNSR